jgi:hypothetical protein
MPPLPNTFASLFSDLNSFLNSLRSALESLDLSIALISSTRLMREATRASLSAGVIAATSFLVLIGSLLLGAASANVVITNSRSINIPDLIFILCIF